MLAGFILYKWWWELGDDFILREILTYLNSDLGMLYIFIYYQWKMKVTGFHVKLRLISNAYLDNEYRNFLLYEV